MEEDPLKEVEQFDYDLEKNKFDYVYSTYDFSRSITGFFKLEVTVRGPSVIYLLFDELVDNKDGNFIVDYKRNNTSNVIKLNFSEEGLSKFLTLEPYTARYVTLIITPEVDVKLSIVDFENSEVSQLKFITDDEEVNLIIKAAQNTLAQNAVDILMDCPSRERAGWLADSYFLLLRNAILLAATK